YPLSHEWPVPMPAPLEVRVFDRQQLVFTAECAGPVELGRTQDAAERPYSAVAVGGQTRIVIAKADENHVPRRAVLVESSGHGRVRLRNLSVTVAIGVEGEPALAPSAEREVPLPVVLLLGPRAVRIQAVP